MLIRFAVKNHRSIKDRQELSLVAGPYKEHPDALIKVPKLGVDLLPAAAIYGANASGKSSVLDAMRFFIVAIKNSHSRWQADSLIPRAPFRLDETSGDSVSEFEAEILVSGMRLIYGFSCNDREFTAEWLHAFPSRRRQVWFEREAGKPIHFGKSLVGPNKTAELAMRNNSLFLSTAAQNNHKILSLVLPNFLTNSFFNSAIDRAKSRYLLFDVSDKFREQAFMLIKNADVGISQFRLVDNQDHEPSEFEWFSDMVSGIPKQDIMFAYNKLRQKIEFSHASDSSEPVYFDFKDESAGTQKLAHIAGPIISALENGKMFFFDEIESSLHPHLSRAIVSLFTNPATNKKGAQLIFTTHDTNLLSADLMRRDQIWFTEKDKTGATHLYPLTDIKTRNTGNIEKGYLEGRFGAIPYLGSLQDLFKTEK